ncbi:MAG: aminotransferase class III-fold pyridoxal phosphate-dependent enzyme [Phycisphaeraceae bacterium]
MTLIAEQFASDPRLAQAKRLILDALAEHQKKLIGVKPADPARLVRYDELLASFGDVRGGGLYYRYLGSGIGNSSLVELADGSVKYDFISGIGVHYFGHSHPMLVESGIDAAVSDTVMQGNLQQNTNSARLGKTLTDLACKSGAKLKHCFLTTSGAMANENALKLALQKHAPASRILAFENCFMGRTIVLSQITDRPQYREGMPATVNVDYVPYFDGDRAAASTKEAVAILKQHIARYPGQHAVMPMEVVAGEGGFRPGSREFFLALIEVLKENHIAVYVDEVQTFGRLHQMFGFQHFGLDEHVDICTIGKMTQVCATLFTDDYKPRPGLMSQTFTGSTASITAAQAIVDTLASGSYYGDGGRVAQVHNRFTGRLQSIAKQHPTWVRGPYGLGGMIAFTPFDGSADAAKKVAMTLFDNGVICFIAGSNPTRVRFLIPIGAVTDNEIDQVAGIVEKTLASLAAL